MPATGILRVRNVSKSIRWVATALIAAGLGAVAAQGQVEEPAGPTDTFNIPENVQILGNASPNLRRATANVNGSIITGTDVEHRVALIIAANEATPSEEELQQLKLQVLRNLIDETLQIQEAAALDRPVEGSEVEDTYARVAADRNMTPQALDQYLRSIGSSPASLKRQIEGELASDWLLRNIVAPFVNVSASEVGELYDRLQASRGTAEYRLGEIYLSATAATRDAVGQNAQRIVEQLRQGGSFVAYARQFSEASTAAVGGDLGWIRIEQLQNPQLEAVARDLQPGQLVGPIEIPGGFSILYMIDKRQIGMPDPRDAVLSLKQISLDFAPGTTEEEARRLAEAFAAGVAEIRGCGEADSAAAALGASVVTNDQVVVRNDLPEGLQAMVLGLNVGQATQPFGTLDEGVRVLMLCGRDDPESTTGPDRETLMAQLRDDRVNKRLQRYLRDLRRDAVIEYN